jgi:hypothetical protein
MQEHPLFGILQANCLPQMESTSLYLLTVAPSGINLMCNALPVWKASPSLSSNPARTLWLFAVMLTYIWRNVIYYGDHRGSTRFCHLGQSFGESPDCNQLYCWAPYPQAFVVSFLCHLSWFDMLTCHIFRSFLRIVWQLPTKIQSAPVSVSLFHDGTDHLLHRLSSNRSQLVLYL